MSGHIRRRGARSWELKFDLGRHPVTGKRETLITVSKAPSGRRKPSLSG
jgi:hypothetical protein